MRISKKRQTFEKGYVTGWSEEIFIVTDRFLTTPVTYAIKDVADDEIKGRFYEPELQLIVKEDSVYDVEKVLKAIRREGETAKLNITSSGEAIRTSLIPGQTHTASTQ